jgi:hypothetical protein
MSDVEFQRELSPDQLNEALSLLDGATGPKVQHLEVGNLSAANDVDPGADQASTTIGARAPSLASVALQQSTKHLSIAVFYGLGIAAAAMLTLVSWSERAPTPPSVLGVSHEQLPNQPAVQLVKSASTALPVAKAPLDQSPGGSEPLPSKPPVAGSNPVGHAGRDDDQAATNHTANSASAIPYAAQTDTVTATATRGAGWDEGPGRKPKKALWHAQAGRLAAAEKRFWRPHLQARAQINRGPCFFFVCLPWQAYRVSYEPPRNVNQ